MNITIFGLGYVGTVSAACFSELGHRVTGIDVNQDKVESINAGRSPVIEPGLAEKIQAGVAAGNLRASCDYKRALSESEISLICVGTPSEPNGNIKLDYIRRVAEQIGDTLKHHDHYHTVVIRSTVVPGTLDEVISIIADRSGKQPGADFGGCSNPEFLREGSAIVDFQKPPFTVIGEYSAQSGEIVSRLYKGVDAPLVRTTVGAAEMIKYACNIFHALKVGFANEIGVLCKSHGIDSHAVMDVFCKDDKLNLSRNYLKPGFAFGGSCLPKDIRAMVYQSRQRDIDLPIIQSILTSNSRHIGRTVDVVLAAGKKRIGVLGLAFKTDTDDLRESPMVSLVESLLGKGCQMMIYDVNVAVAKLTGINRAYIDEKIPHVSQLLTDDLDEIARSCDVIVVGHKCKAFATVVTSLKPSQIVIDLVRVLQDAGQTKATYHGLSW